jgi:hypothetical protein
LVATTPALREFQFQATCRFHSRPVLTLTALRDVLSHPTLQHLCLDNVMLWGGGGAAAAACASALRGNELRTLRLRRSVLAASSDAGAVVTGLAGHRRLRSLDLAGTVLHGREAESLGGALRRNASLRTLSLEGVRFGVRRQTHRAVLRRTVMALSEHPRLETLNVRGARDASARESEAVSAEFAETAVASMLRRNRVLTRVETDQPSAAVAMHTGLNRAGFWKLSQAESSSREWTDAMGAVSDQLDCQFVMLRNNPLLCGGR